MTQPEPSTPALWDRHRRSQRTGYVRTPRVALFDLGLSAQAYRLLHVLYAWADRGMTVPATRADLAAVLGLERRQVARLVTSLVNAGYVAVSSARPSDHERLTLLPNFGAAVRNVAPEPNSVTVLDPQAATGPESPPSTGEREAGNEKQEKEKQELSNYHPTRRASRREHPRPSPEVTAAALSQHLFTAARASTEINWIRTKQKPVIEAFQAWLAAGISADAILASIEAFVHSMRADTHVQTIALAEAWRNGRQLDDDLRLLPLSIGSTYLDWAMLGRGHVYSWSANIAYLESRAGRRRLPQEDRYLRHAVDLFLAARAVVDEDLAAHLATLGHQVLDARRPLDVHMEAAGQESVHRVPGAAVVALGERLVADYGGALTAPSPPRRVSAFDPHSIERGSLAAPRAQRPSPRDDRRRIP